MHPTTSQAARHQRFRKLLGWLLTTTMASAGPTSPALAAAAAASAAAVAGTSKGNTHTTTTTTSSAADMVPIREARVEVRHGNPVVVINGAPTYWACHYLRHYRAKMHDKWPVGVRNAVRQFAARGIHRFEVQVDLGWDGVNERFDAKSSAAGPALGAMMPTIVSADPRAQVVLRIGAYSLLPELLPAAFKAANPGELETDQNGRTYSISFASDSGFAQLSHALAREVAYAEAQPWGGHIAGYNIFLEFEGVPWGSGQEGAFTDYSPAMLRSWRHYLAVRYHNDAGLRAAWHDSGATLAGATVPTPQEQLGDDPRALFFDPARGRKVRDYYELMDDLTVKRHRQVGVAVKQACRYRKLVGLMGGYSQDAGEPRSIVSPDGFPPLQLHKQHFSGPGCWGRAFAIPEIDFYFAPRDYLNTGMGGVCIPLHMPASLRLHGKVAWLEDDQRTYLHRGIFNPELKDARESIMAHRRNAALLYTECGATDWMEQISNWLIDPPLLDNLGRLNRLLQHSVNAPAVPANSLDGAICVLFDEESEGTTKPTTLLDEELFYHQRNEGLSHCGVPVRFHLLSDLALPNFPKYKFYILPNAYHWTAAKQKLLQRVAERDGNVVLWLYGAGYVGDTHLGVDGMMRATGMKLVAEPHPWEHRISITDFAHPITHNLPADLTFGTSRHYGPIFRVADPTVRVLGRSFGFAMNRDPALAIKTFGRGARGDVKWAGAVRGAGDFASVYCEAPNLPADLLRGLARYAGCHVYLDSNDFLLAGKDLVMVHSAKAGPRILHLNTSSDVVDWATGNLIARAVSDLHFSLAQPGTALFLLKPANSSGSNRHDKKPVKARQTPRLSLRDKHSRFEYRARDTSPRSTRSRR